MIRLVSSFILLSITFSARAQQVTGVWKGKIDKKNVEVKIIQKGDSLTGTSYYYESSKNYRRYSIKGYFDPNNNSVIWWDDQLIEDKGDKPLGGASRTPLLSEADFNCPGGGEMYLDGKSSPKRKPEQKNGIVALTKIHDPQFPDEWDYVVDNYTIGANDPDIIDSVFLIAFTPYIRPHEEPVVIENKKEETPPVLLPGMTSVPTTSALVITPEIKPLTIEEKYISREKVFTADIPIEGDSVELRFYDNAEVDGDSISLFLNARLIFTHIRLTDKAYSIKLPVQELADTNELTMVAENLGSIPPNTSYMVALVGDKRYEAKLASTENSSAMIRLVKQ
jgi:hypothetical protein